MQKTRSSTAVVIILLVGLFAVFGACSDDKSTNAGEGGPGGLYYWITDEFPSWSSNGWIVFNHTQQGSTDTQLSGLYLIRPDGTDLHVLYQGELLTYPVWSPDGQWITFSRHGQLCKISFDGSQIDTLTEKGYYFPSAWSPDGNQIAYEWRVGDSSGIWIMERNGSNRRLVIRYGHQPDWPYPDSLVYAMYDGVSPYGAMCIADTLGESPRIFFDPHERFVGNKMYPELHPETGLVLFNPQVPGEIPDIWSMRIDGSGLERITYTGFFHPSFSPDGKEVVCTDGRVGNGRLWIMNLDGSEKRQITGVQ